MPAPEDLSPTFFLDFEHPDVAGFATRVTSGAPDERAAARALFAAVRDEIRYDPYRLPTEAEDYRASAVLRAGQAFCVGKAVLLCAAARAVDIPARLGFADVRNHLQSERLAALMGTDLFVYHGYSVLYVGEAWRKASPAFNAGLCARFGVAPLDFDGSSDALLHAYTGDGRRHMEYVTDHGTRADLPLDEVLGAIRAAYPRLVQARSAESDPAS